MTDDKKFLDIQARAGELSRMYLARPKRGNVSILLASLFSGGKTTFACTGPKPILIDSFDPNGTVVIETNYRKELEAGEIIIRDFWDEDSERPSQFERWGKEHDQDIRSGFLNHFGTYCIDTLTTQMDTIANWIAKKKGRSEGFLQIQDYKIIYDKIKNIIKKTSACDVNFILNCHLIDEKDEVTGEIVANIDTFHRLKSQIPLLFTEKYVIQNRNGVRTLLTEYKSRFRAGTQLGLPPSIELKKDERYLFNILKDAGLDPKDKPALITKAQLA